MQDFSTRFVFVVGTEDTPLAETQGEVCRINRTKFEKMSVAQQIFLIQHETGHAYLCANRRAEAEHLEAH